MMNQLLAQLTENMTPVGILIAWNGALSVALAALYRDCRKDRDRLWARLGGRQEDKEQS